MKQFLSLLLVVFVLGCTGYVTGNNVVEEGDEMVVEVGDHVSVHYTGTLDDGSVFDSSEGREPLEFDVGAGQMIKGFDSGVVGMKTGEEKNIRLNPEDAYGTKDEKLVVDVPLSQLPGSVKAGDTLSAQGQPVKVVSLDNKTAKVDFNHPLAGQTLNFKVKIVEIDRK